jgi:hypothetical protein
MKQKSIGYIRSNCLSKVASLIEPLQKTQLHITRSRVERRIENDSKCRWLTYTLEGKSEFDLNWNIWKDRVPFQTVLNKLTFYKQKYNLDDFVVGHIELGIQDPSLIACINRKLAHKYPPTTIFYVTFTNKPISRDVLNGWDADIVREINQKAISNLRFKRGVLDLTEIKSDPDLGINLDRVLFDKEVIFKILEHLDTRKWFKLLEIQALTEETGEKYYPGVIRTYEQSKENRWVFVGEEEVK